MGQGEECKGCRFWLAQDKYDGCLGLCRRYAPYPATVNVTDLESDGKNASPTHESFWPVTASEEWCGEWTEARS